MERPRVGHVASRYEIVEKLGEGGMGVVYRARDTKLGRFVALKFLGAQRALDPERRQRFAQEAQALSALNNPHIVTIHDVDEADGSVFIAMEYVEGQTLSQRIGRRALPLHDALHFGSQIADALAQAHVRGIVHRDLKPSNIVVTSDGVVKVLDFGLAKLLQSPLQDDGTTAGKPATDEGIVMGTASYMSPEQAQGRPVDPRSDIFSFGSLLYEMVTGRRAFAADTKVGALAAILKEEPRPASEVVSTVPRDLDRLIQHCMRKDPARRFQHIDDVRTLLDQLREDSDSGRLGAATPPAPEASSGWVLAGFGIALAAAVAIGVWSSRHSAPVAEAPLVSVPLTAYPGLEIQPSFSPDGNEIAFVWNGEKEDNYDIYRKLIGPGEPLRLTHDPLVDLSPAWSPDGRYVAFLRGPQHGPFGIFLVPALGGAERRVGEVRGPGDLWELKPSGLAWTADGEGLVVSDHPDGESPGLFLLSLEGGAKRRLTSTPFSTDNEWRIDSDPALGPDGRTLAFARSRAYADSDVYVANLDAGLAVIGTPEPRTFEHRQTVSPVWLDTRSLVYSVGNRFAERQLLRLPLDARPPAAPASPLSVGTDATNLAYSAKARRLVFSQNQRDANIYQVGLRGPGQLDGEYRSFIASTRFDYEASYSPAGDRVSFMSTRSGSMEIWVANVDGSSPRQVTSIGGAITGNARWSPDGRQLVFDSLREGKRNLYVVNPQSGAPRQLTSSEGIVNESSWSSDGRWIYFNSTSSGTPEVWKMPAGGGQAVQVTRRGGVAAIESPDGRWLYYCKGPAYGTELWRAPLAGGAEERLLDDVANRLSYAVTNEGVYYNRTRTEMDKFTLAFLDLRTHQVKELLSTGGRMFIGVSVSPDGRSLIWAQADNYGADLVLVEGFR